MSEQNRTDESSLPEDEMCMPAPRLKGELLCEYMLSLTTFLIPTAKEKSIYGTFCRPQRVGDRWLILSDVDVLAARL